MTASENLKNVQKRMISCINRTGHKVPSWNEITEDLQAFQELRKLLWDAQEGISVDQKEQIIDVVNSFLDACVERRVNHESKRA